MFPYLLGLTTLGSVKPYFRKHVFSTLEPIDFMFANSLLISIFIAAYFTYIYVCHNHVIKRSYENCSKLTYTQIAALVILAGFTVVSSLWFFHLEKNFNTPFVNNILLKSFSLLALFLVSYFIFEEKYHAWHMLGIVLTVAGLVVLLFNPTEHGAKVMA